MPAKLTLHAPQRATRSRVIRDGESLVVGRHPSCDLVDLRPPRVQAPRPAPLVRRRLEARGPGKQERHRRQRRCRPPVSPSRTATRSAFGGLLASFERLTAAQAATLDTERLALMEASARMRRQVRDGSEPADLLLCFLEATMELTRTERGFILLVSSSREAARRGGRRPLPGRRAGRALSAAAWGRCARPSRAEGSVVLSDVRADPVLGKRPSVVSRGIASLACVPIRHEGTILGVIYVDSRKLGPALTELELETLESMAEHVGAILTTSARRGQDRATRARRRKGDWSPSYSSGSKSSSPLHDAPLAERPAGPLPPVRSDTAASVDLASPARARHAGGRAVTGSPARSAGVGWASSTRLVTRSWTRTSRSRSSGRTWERTRTWVARFRQGARSRPRDHAQERGAHPRHRRERRPALPHDAPGRGPLAPRSPAGGRPPGGRPRPPHLPPGGGGPPAGPRRGHRPPRPEARRTSSCPTTRRPTSPTSGSRARWVETG